MAIGSTIANMVKSLRRRVRLGLVTPFMEGLHGQIAVETNLTSLMKANRHWVHFCANLNSTSVAAVPLRLYVSKASASQKTLTPTKAVPFTRLEYMESRPELQHWMRKGIAIDEVLQHPLLDVFKKVNPFMGIYSLLELTNWAEELTGNAYWYIVGNGLGLPAQLWPLPSHRMQPILSKKKLVSGYVFDKGLVTQTIYNADEIVHFKFPNPIDWLIGRSPLQAIIASYNTFEHMQDYQLSIFKNLGTPSVYLQSDKHVSEADKTRTLEMLRNQYGGTSRAGMVAFLTGGLKFETVQFTPTELALLEGKKSLKEEILGAYGVPVSKTTSENVNKANADAGERQYQRDTVKPRIRRLEEMINEFLTSRYDADNIFVAFDNPVPDDEKMETEREYKRLERGVIVVNEVREARGLGPPVSWGDKPYNPNAGQIVGEEGQPKQQGEGNA